MTVRPDNRLADAPMVSVTCRRCRADVQVRKSSWNQTSVQWTAAASQLCEERCQAAQLESHGGRLFLTCSALAESITAAVHSGSLSVVDTDAF
ncbi:ferredoxin [Mycobacterium sp. PSTR-4-N]|uniref:ferredoxin n=1 Tax=Mycobacterium sp. PSTR-4-N TaxID=2917745 RepID=UPI001F1550BC|nr:ferredoxin [Mycobacterium sp. PSTR-4-N]MCG7592534.1 ferredoxin [Mycobacterium sp. PSTR-4-N]